MQQAAAAAAAAVGAAVLLTQQYSGRAWWCCAWLLLAVLALLVPLGPAALLLVALGPAALVRLGQAARPAARKQQHETAASSAHDAYVQQLQQHAWREMVGSPEVAAAWEKLCGSIVQEVSADAPTAWQLPSASACNGAPADTTASLLRQFLYDAWWCHVSPDREFPAEARMHLNHMFAQLCRRARHVDWPSLLVRCVRSGSGALHMTRPTKRHCGSCSWRACHPGQQQHTQLTLPSRCHTHRRAGVDAATSTLQLYRAAAAQLGPDLLRALPPAAADAAIRAALLAPGAQQLAGRRAGSSSLHPAFSTPEGHYMQCRQLSEAVLRHLLAPEAHACRLVRTLTRELLATCVLRSCLLLVAPHNVHRVRACSSQGLFMRICCTFTYALTGD